MLENFIPRYMKFVAPSGEASFGWQGGEPTLAGLHFFKSIVEMQHRHGIAGTVVSNDIQTNGILVDEEWATFFSDYRFLVGVSLDGPEDVHNMMRPSPAGSGSFSQAMAAIEVLRKNDFDLNILSVVGPHNVHLADRLLSFFVSEGFSHIQFLPAMNFSARAPDQPADYLVNTSDLADFLKTSFDIWYGDGYPRFSIRTFDSFLQSYLGLESGLCIHASQCDPGLVIETGGDVYPCDFYLQPRFRVGNISSDPIEELVHHTLRLAFIQQKKNLPDACRSCRWQRICNGGCPRNRAGLGTDCLCGSYDALFEHADTRFRQLAERMKRRSRFLKERNRRRALGHPPPGRNAPCLCQSNRKHKKCCGHPALMQSYLFREEP